jgi:HEPN domain-containing protein
MKDPKGEAAKWFAQAEYDLRAAQTNADNALYAYACFIAQQAAEKALKAFLYGQGERPVLGHSVATLCGRAAKSRKEFSALAQKARRLDRFYIPTRYPNGLPDGIPAESYDASDAQDAITLAQEFCNTVKKYLNV